MKILISLTFAASLLGCALPTTTVTTGTSRPTLTVQGAPQNTVLFVDGLEMGNAAQYNGVTQSLLIEAGTHEVQLRQGTQVLMSQKIFASAGENSKLVYKSESNK
jgi:hypothetical protein